MFDVEIQAGISKVSVKVKEKDGITKRTCTITLEREFDAVIASGIGSEARDALLALETGGMESCVLPMDAIDAEAVLVAGFGDDRVRIRALTGVKATAKKGDEEDGLPPSVQMQFEFPWEEEAWVFFGRHCAATVVMTLRRRQLEMARPKRGKKLAAVGGPDADPNGVDTTPPPGAAF